MSNECTKSKLPDNKLSYNVSELLNHFSLHLNALRNIRVHLAKLNAYVYAGVINTICTKGGN